MTYYPTETELSAIERRVDALHMTDSERLVAMAALRNSFVIVERFAGLAQKIAEIGAPLFSKPRLSTSANVSAPSSRRVPT